MTTSLEAMKAARGRLQDLRESEFYWGKFLAATRCGIRRALTLLDAAIQREEAEPPSGVVSREGLEEALREYDYESTVRSQDRRHQANQGFRLARALLAALLRSVREEGARQERKRMREPLERLLVKCEAMGWPRREMRAVRAAMDPTP